jgi:hypothetical protein
METIAYPKGTTKEQWDRYESEMKAHDERVKRLQPDPAKYGFESSSLENQGGWTIEGGEQAFRRAVSEWEMMRSCDAPNKPGYYRANND